MAARQAPSVCLACQARQALIGRRRPTAVKRRRISIDVRPESLGAHGTMADGADEELKDAAAGERTSVAVEGSDKPWKIDMPLDDVRDALQSMEVLWKEKEKRIRVLRSLSNPWPKMMHQTVHNEVRRSSPAATLQLPEANGAPIPHEVFRHHLATARGEKLIRKVLRAQLLRCETPKDILRVVATALVQSRQTQSHIAALHEPLMRALYRCRNNVNDQAVLNTLSSIASRFRLYGLPLDPQFIMLGLKFAARTRNLKDMKKYLKLLRESNLQMSSNVFRAIIAKFSIGHRGLGEIRNGRWKRSELHQVCTGFPECGHLPPEEQYHLGAWLDRADWQYLHGWIAVLARCRDTEGVWHEWQLWKNSEGRERPKSLKSEKTYSTTKTRGDYWFLEQLAFAGGLKQAWQILEETDTEFSVLKSRITDCLLEGVEYATVITPDIRKALLEKYDRDLLKIEQALGVRWIPAVTSHIDGSQGRHLALEDQEDRLERLTVEDWKLEEDYGYPYDEPIVRQEERGLHDAVEMETG